MYIDYVAVVGFIISPFVFGFSTTTESQVLLVYISKTFETELLQIFFAKHQQLQTENNL